MGADHYDAVLLIVVRGVEVCFCDDLNASGFQVCYYFFVVDDRPQGEDWFLFGVDEFVDFVHGSLNSEAEAAVSATFTFIISALSPYKHQGLHLQRRQFPSLKNLQAPHRLPV